MTHNPNEALHAAMVRRDERRAVTYRSRKAHTISATFDGESAHAIDKYADRLTLITGKRVLRPEAVRVLVQQRLSKVSK